jgi:hypothetical protein
MKKQELNIPEIIQNYGAIELMHFIIKKGKKVGRCLPVPSQ